MPVDRKLIQKMFQLAEEWEAKADRRAIFLRCYSMMTENMCLAIDQKRFQDNEWVEGLLRLFADYYFDALTCFDCGEDVPKIWESVHQAAAFEKQLHVLQHLLMGVNAHINYDLVLTLYDLLHPEWEQLSESQRKTRYEDHCLVNTIIAETIDAVQDEVIEKHAPSMEWLDQLMGRLDEYLTVSLIRRWRDEVWQHTMALLQCKEQIQRQAILRQVEEDVFQNAQRLQLKF